MLPKRIDYSATQEMHENVKIVYYHKKKPKEKQLCYTLGIDSRVDVVAIERQRRRSLSSFSYVYAKLNYATYPAPVPRQQTNKKAHSCTLDNPYQES